MDDMTRQKRQARLIAGYHRISPGQRDVLNKTVRRLTELPSVPLKTVSRRNNAEEAGKSAKGGLMTY
jgi:hypothetical protein